MSHRSDTNMSSQGRLSRRWYQFRLRTLLVLLTVIAAICGYCAKLHRDANAQRQFVTRIWSWGGSVNYDFERRTPGEDFSSRAWEEIPWYQRTFPNYFGNVSGVNISQRETSLPHGSFSDSDTMYLIKMPHLKELSLHLTDITDNGVRQISQLQELEALYLCGPLITDAALKHLKKMKRLKKLALVDVRCTKGAVDELREALPETKIEFWPLPNVG